MVQQFKQISERVRESGLPAYSLPVILALLAGACLWQGLKSEPTPVETKPVVSLTWAQPRQQTKPIREIRVGDRVLAHNPQVSDEERATWEEPKAEDLLHLSLEMRLPDGGLLAIEMLRPIYWVEEHEAAVGGTIELNLAEMGAVGSATVRDIRPCPPLTSGTERGKIVTATFAHPPSNQVLDVWFEGGTTPVGVTDNHLFWSVEKENFAPIGEMAVGEQVFTCFGETKRIERKLPRFAPQVVYNLEVFGEHVYFVADLGVLVHNAYQVQLKASANFGKQSHGGRAKQFLEKLTGKKIVPKLKTQEGTEAVLRGWEEVLSKLVLLKI